jgi:DNA polymerase-3 subunit alpha
LHDHDDECSGKLVALGDPDAKVQRKPMRYVSLHHHSTFSFLDGYQLPEAHARRIAELNGTALAMTEHGNVASHQQLDRAAAEHGIKPLFGCELYCGSVTDAKSTRRKNHLTVLAESQEGYRNLLRTVTQSWQEASYGHATTSWKNLKEHNEGLIVLSGCTGSLLATSLVGGKNIAPEDAGYARARRVASQFKQVFGDRYYLEVQAFPELAATRAINGGLARLSADLRIPLVATGDVHYTLPTESEMQRILHETRGQRRTSEQSEEGWGYDVPLCPPVNDKTILDRLISSGLTRKQAREAVLATEEIAQRSTVELPKMPLVKFPMPSGYQQSSEVWRDWLKRGWHYRKLSGLPSGLRSKYRKQLLYEMKIIEDKDYIDYFLIVSDIVKFAKDSGIPVGPARGSAAASLVCYLLRITEVDPLKFPTLVFERFIDVSRQDLPDIDLDFDSERRWEIREYAERKYGKDHVGLVGTFTMYKAKNSLDDVARVYRIPPWELESVKEVLIERSGGDLRANSTLEDTVSQFEQAQAKFDAYPDLYRASDLEGNVKGMGSHAAGLIVSPAPLDDVTAVYRRKVKDMVVDVIGLDKHDAERMGLLKIDVLGLSTMTMLRDALEQIGEPLEFLYSIPLDDARVIRGFHDADVVGIFQFDGRAMRNITQELRPDSFDEIADINALARPGPLHNGATGVYIDVKHGRRRVAAVHPLLDAITATTHGQIVYQEQILRICREIGNFDWTHAAYIRKIISKKLGEQEFRRQYEAFKDGALSHEGMTESMAADIWNRCITAGAYAFNSAHSVSYGMLAWWCMWFKVHHPTVFYCAALRKLSDEKQLDLLKDATRHDIEILPPHYKRSGISWGIDRGRLRGGLVQVHGIGPKSAPKFMEYREEHGVSSWEDYQNIKGVGPKTIENIRTFITLEDPYRIHWLKNRIESVRSELTRDMGLPPTTHTSETIPYAKGTRDTMVTWLGMPTQRNLKDLFELHFSRTGEELDPVSVRDPELRDWVVMWCEDDGEPVIVTIDRWKYRQYKKAIWNMRLGHDLILVQGKKKANQARRAIYADRLWVIDPEDE